MSSSLGCCLRYPVIGVSWKPRSFSYSIYSQNEQKIAAKIRNYHPIAGLNVSKLNSRASLTSAVSVSSRFNFLPLEDNCKRFFSCSSNSLILQASKKEINKDTAATNGKTANRHSLIELFRDLQHNRSITAHNSLQEVEVNGSQLSVKKGAVKEEGLHKERTVEGNRKKQLKSQVRKKDSKVKKERALSNDVEAKGHKASRSKRTGTSTVSVKTKEINKSLNQENTSTIKRNFMPLFPPCGKSVMVVESATKAKTIQNYLGDMFNVLPTYGHVRDLAGRSGSVRPDEDFSMVWEVPSSAWTHLKTIKVALDGAKTLILATDPDREGEAIAWHLVEMLLQQDALKDSINVVRVVFCEITDASIKGALQSPRNLDMNLVNAYLARRALDYLIGFSVSPLLWRKLPGCQSAGRVQSAALSLICDKEMEIDLFKPQEYWTIEAQFHKAEGGSLIFSELILFDSKRLNQFCVGTQEDAEFIKKSVCSSDFVVLDVKKNKFHRNPPMPYITSSLQQDAANKLHFTATYTMKLAQKLYEGVILSDEQATGLITYMRTDGLHTSDAAAREIHTLVKQRYGQNYASKVIKIFFKKVKNAQEAHEAIRPTNIWRLPSTLVGVLDEDSLKLYTLIWTRTVASQMEAACSDTVQVDIGNPKKDIIFHSRGSQISFPGYQAVYKDIGAGVIGFSDTEETSSTKSFQILSLLSVNDQLCLKMIDCMQHHTKPPGRYSEGSLVKKLEELGIGRPSTYAPILRVLQDRKYVLAKGRVLHPEFRGRMVSAFLCDHFSEVSDYSFTADMETELDNVSSGSTEWKGLLKDYWTRFKAYCDIAANVHIRQLEKMLEKKFADILFGKLHDKNRMCPSCLQGNLVFKISRYGNGYFIGCDQHPKCKYIHGMILNDEEEDDDLPPEKPNKCFHPKLLGHSPDTNEKILLKKGPYGYYVQLGEDRKGSPPKRTSLEGKDVEALTLEDAIELLRYPIILGNHPIDANPVILSHSKYGFSVRHKRTIAPVPKNKDPKTITLEAALKFLKSKKAKQTGRKPSKQVSKEEILT